MPSDRPVDKEEFDVMEHQQEPEPDFFSLFGLPTYEDGVNFGSSITSSIRRPMSAILAVVDNALAVLNEEFDSSEDSLMSSSSNDTDANQQATSSRSGHTNNSNVSGCRRRTRRTKTTKMGTIESSASSSTSNGTKQNSVDSLSDSNSDGDDVLMKSSVIGSISKLVLHDEFNAKEQKKDGIDANMADNLPDGLASDLEKKVDSSEYFMVKPDRDRETKDGWLVVIDQ